MRYSSAKWDYRFKRFAPNNAKLHPITRKTKNRVLGPQELRASLRQRGSLRAFSLTPGSAQRRRFTRGYSMVIPPGLRLELAMKTLKARRAKTGQDGAPTHSWVGHPSADPERCPRKRGSTVNEPRPLLTYFYYGWENVQTSLAVAGLSKFHKITGVPAG